MLPRITKISRIRDHPTDSSLLIVQVYGSEHRIVVTQDDLFIGQKVLFIPLGVRLSKKNATALGILPHCKDLGGVMQVVACDFSRVVSHGIVLPVATVRFALKIKEEEEDEQIIKRLFLSPPSSSIPPLADLINNPSLLNALLEIRVWMCERVQGMEICLHYDASKDKVCFWDETNCAHGWWMSYRPSAKEILKPQKHLFAHADALLTIGRQRYGKGIDIYLRGIAATDKRKEGEEVEEEQVYFYECALHGAGSFALSTEQFLKMCETSRFPRMPTIATNQTLKSIINEKLKTKRILLLPGDISFVTKVAASKKEDSIEERHVYDYSAQEKKDNERKEWLSDSASAQSFPPPSSQNYEKQQYERDARGEKRISQSLSTSLSGEKYGSNGRQAFGTSFGRGLPTFKRQNNNNALKQNSWKRQTPLDDENASFESDWYGNVAKERVDWAQSLMLLANQIVVQQKSNTIGLAIQIYSGSDLLRILEQFKFMRFRVGAEVISEQHLLRAK